MNGDGISVLFADLGEYDGYEIRSEFDPAASAIRINSRLLKNLSAGEAQRFVAHAIAHELFHYLEHHGRVRRARNRKAREERAERFAHALTDSLT